MNSYDTIVVGLGGAGSAAAYHLARSRSSVLGLEQFGPVHPYGSSHGKSRIYRTAYFEGKEYVPLVRRAQELWFRLQEESGERVIRRTGGLMLGLPSSPTVDGALATARAWALDHSLLGAVEVRERFPQFLVRDDEVALWDPEAGVLFPETCIRAHAAGAVDGGAELHYGEAVRSWHAEGDAVEVETRTGRYRARSLVLTCGAWTARVAGELDLPLEVERQFMLWFPSTESDLVSPERMPVFLWDRGPDGHSYGLPDLGDGVKVGSWEGKVAGTPETADREFRETEAEPVRRFVARSLRGVIPREREHVSCLYTNAPDHHFLLGRHPRYPNVQVVSACSGHGFKFTSVVGEIVAQLARGTDPPYDLTPFDPGRFRTNPR